MTNHTPRTRAEIQAEIDPEQIVDAECPFCGVTDMSCLQGELLVGEHTADNTEIVRIHCQGCGAMGPIVELQIEAGRLADPPWEAWNRRALPARAGRDPEKLDALLEAAKALFEDSVARTQSRCAIYGEDYGKGTDAEEAFRSALAAFEGGSDE